MGKPIQKKRATVILSSDDEDDVKPTLTRATAPRTRRTVTATKKAPRANATTPQGRKKRIELDSSPASQRSLSSPSQQPKTKPIYSFFNTATQKQQATSKVEKLSLKEDPKDLDEDDIIEDNDSLDEELSSFSQTKSGSKFPIPVGRKRKLEDIDGGILESSSVPKGSQLFKKAAVEANEHVSRPVVDQRPWTERFGPVNLSELAVHKKKVQDVKNWLQNVTHGREHKRLLILKGPAGSGKTTTINLLSQELELQINEWRTSGTISSDEGFISMSAQFEDYVVRTGTFGTLDVDGGNKPSPTTSQTMSEKGQLVLIEEFPNTFSKSSGSLQSFRTAVLHYLEASTPPLSSMFAAQIQPSKPVVPIVMIISESLLSTSTASSDSFTAYRLLGPDILGHTGTTMIEFNPIASTFMIKALDTIITKEARKSGRKRAPGPSVLKHLAEIGDVRSAVSSLEFLCLRGDESTDWTGRVTFTKAKRGKEAVISTMEKDSLEIITQRESTLGIFHSVGKVVYNKREAPSATTSSLPQPPNHLPQHARPKASEVDIESLLNELGTDISTFNAAIHENYILSCQGLDTEETLEHVNGCIDFLSDADLLSPDRFSSRRHKQMYAGTGLDSLRQDEISFQTSVRGLLFSLPHPVKRINPSQPTNNSSNRGSAFGSKTTAYQMFYPASMRLWRIQEETEGLLDTVLVKLRDHCRSKGQSSNGIGAKGPSLNAVETWRLNRFGGQATQPSTKEIISNADEEEVAASDLGPSLGGTMAKQELLLERLPYILHLRTRNTHSELADLTQDIKKIAQMDGHVGIVADEDEDGNGDGEAGHECAEQWSTDQPAQEMAPKRKTFGLRKQTKETGAVKDKMESLVLDDDDIEDS